MPTYVSNADEFNNAIRSNSTIIVTEDIFFAYNSFPCSLLIQYATNLVINGDGHKIQSVNACNVIVVRASEVSFHNLYITGDGKNENTLTGLKGGGLIIITSTVTMTSCTLTGNVADLGGAVYLSDNLFSYNHDAL